MYNFKQALGKLESKEKLEHNKKKVTLNEISNFIKQSDIALLFKAINNGIQLCILDSKPLIIFCNKGII